MLVTPKVWITVTIGVPMLPSVTNWVQVSDRAQHLSTACQTRVMTGLQPLDDVELLTKETTTLLQHASNQAGGLVGIGAPQATVMLLHSNSGGEGSIVMDRVQRSVVP